jgi:hypothetical protein
MMYSETKGLILITLLIVILTQMIKFQKKLQKFKLMSLVCFLVHSDFSLQVKKI